MDINTLLDASFRGNIYIVQNNRVLYEKESGFANLPNEIPNTPETKFSSASAGKVFVAVAILQLVEQGRIKLDDTLGVLLDMIIEKVTGMYFDQYLKANIFDRCGMVSTERYGADGAFITVKDVVRFWTHLLDGSQFYLRIQPEQWDDFRSCE